MPPWILSTKAEVSKGLPTKSNFFSAEIAETSGLGVGLAAGVVGVTGVGAEAVELATTGAAAFGGVFTSAFCAKDLVVISKKIEIKTKFLN